MIFFFDLALFLEFIRPVRLKSPEGAAEYSRGCPPPGKAGRYKPRRGEGVQAGVTLQLCWLATEGTQEPLQTHKPVTRYLPRILKKVISWQIMHICFATKELFRIFVANYNKNMKEYIIGREYEKHVLGSLLTSAKSEFVAVCGRRRVGKTFLIREYFEDVMLFQTAGLASGSTRQQIKSFYEDMLEYGLQRPAEPPRDWIDIFTLLRQLIKQSDNERKVILLDELPWMDTPRSGFISALEHFWNTWASSRRDVVLIVCGSATSWMMDKLINSHGGLHNRLTQRIFLEPFTLCETEQFLKWKGFMLSRYDIATCYMAMGGIPFYLDMLDVKLSIAQNIEQLVFRRNGPLHNEFANLYAALFRNSTDYIRVVETLGHHREGLTRSEVIRLSGLVSGSGLTTVLRNLEACGFIRQRHHYKASRADAVIYQLTDFFSLFHLHFIAPGKVSDWMSLLGRGEYHAWAGLTFELLAWHHLPQMKKALGISGIKTEAYAWRCDDGQKGAQIDLVIERADQTVNICEMKFASAPYAITAAYEQNLRQKLAAFQEHADRRLSLQLTLVTAFGLASGTHSSIVTNEVTLDDLFLP